MRLFELFWEVEHLHIMRNLGITGKADYTFPTLLESLEIMDQEIDVHR
jgi:hypothetical protein